MSKLNQKMIVRQIQRISAFTLIELLIVLAVIGILAAIAYPSYDESVRRGRRADAQALLTESAQWMERFYSQNNNYEVTAAEFANAGFSRVPRNSRDGDQFYTITLVTEAPFQRYTLTATKVNRMANDRCDNFVLNSVGQRLTDPVGGVNCWQR
jgi:type IV pilus assembly protein PilE